MKLSIIIAALHSYAVHSTNVLEERRSLMALIHPPSEDVKTPPFYWEKDGPISESDLSMAMMQLMGAPPTNSEAGERLPVPNLLMPPAANVLFSIRGLDVVDDAEAMPFLHNAFMSSPSSEVYHAEDELNVAPGILGATTYRLNDAMNAIDFKDGYTMCLSSSPSVHSSPLCMEADDCMAGHHEAEAWKQHKTDRFPHYEGPNWNREDLLSTLSKTDATASLTGDVWTYESPALGSANFLMSTEEDRLFLEELDLMARLADTMAKDETPLSTSTRPDLLILSIDNFPMSSDENKSRVAKAMTDAVVNQVMEGLGARYGSQATAAIILDSAAKKESDDYGWTRELAESDGSPTSAPTTANTTTYTIDEINNYQISLWTGIVLILTLAAAICCMVNMEIKPDSLLYAKFQADVSSKME